MAGLIFRGDAQVAEVDLVLVIYAYWLLLVMVLVVIVVVMGAVIVNCFFFISIFPSEWNEMFVFFYLFLLVYLLLLLFLLISKSEVLRYSKHIF